MHTNRLPVGLSLDLRRTVVKHEAFAVRKSGGRAMLAEAPGLDERDESAWTEERAERYEQLRVGAEAMSGLKPQEIRCLLLKAEGLSYEEICAATGFSYTKVNRCLTEGRRAFLKRVAGIEAGAECERLAPLISKVADGEATPEEMRKVRPHLKGCLACKATLREYRATPARLAGLVPPVVALTGGGGAGSGFVGRLLERFAGMGDATGAKVAAVAASAALLAGGGAAGVEALHHDAPPVAPSAYAQEPTATGTSSATTPSSSAAPDPSAAAIEAVANSAPGASPDPQPQPAATPDPVPEFDPGMSGADSAPAPRSASAETAPAASARREASAGSGSVEFAP
jgi:hypothetical protein